MEAGGALSEASWNSFDATMQFDESELMAQFLGTYPCMNEQDQDPSFEMSSMFWSDQAADSYYFPRDVDSSSYYCPRENSSSISTSCFSVLPRDYTTCYLSEPNVVPVISDSSLPMDFSMLEEQIAARSLQVVPTDFFGGHISYSDELGDSSMDLAEPVAIHDQKLQSKRKLQTGEEDNAIEHDKFDVPTENRKKKARASSQVQRRSNNTKSKKTQKSIRSGDEDDSNTALNGQSSSCDSSEDDSNASQELSIGGSASSSSKGSAALNLNGKTRAGRGSATDPQSLYARKRRERINERLKILQNLVPNGTKVDISTMLEEAVEYVKFLQLQIKLLSSNELWMYAPLAYNGMNIGLDLKITPQKQ